MTATPRSLIGTPPGRDPLEDLRLAGAIFLRAEYTEAWALVGQGGPGFVAMMHPGAQRLVLFHVIARGRCRVSLAGGRALWAERGDVIVLPYGDEHTMGGVSPVEPVHIATLLTPPPWTRLPVLRLGEGGPRTDVVCGFLFSQDPLFEPALRALPAAFVVTPPPGPARDWVDASIAYALAGSSATGHGPQGTKLAELLLVEMLRAHLSTAPAPVDGWLAALRDPVLAPAMLSIHTAPERRWTVTDLAAQAGVSRSLLDARFRAVLGLAPIRYLHNWRMHVANDLLTATEATAAAIARRVGYESEAAFSRAFKRACGSAPSQRRTRRS
jgi:AraC-like DNA-binding protein